MTERTAVCACRRVTLSVDGEPTVVSTCHCDFCQRRTGSVFQVCAIFEPDEPFEITGETRTYNGAEMDGAPSVSGMAITYHFCPTCGSTMHWGVDGLYRAVPLGNFVDADLPAPSLETHTSERHPWVPAVPDAQQFPDAFG